MSSSLSLNDPSSSTNLSGLNSSGSFHVSGSWCTFQRFGDTRLPSGMVYPLIVVCCPQQWNTPRGAIELILCISRSVATVKGNWSLSESLVIVHFTQHKEWKHKKEWKCWSKKKMMPEPRNALFCINYTVFKVSWL